MFFPTAIISSAPPIVAGQSGALAGATVGSAYSTTLTTTGGLGGITYSLLSGSLPPGVSLASNGVISGTPTNVGPYSFTVRRTDGYGNTLDTACSITVAAVAIVAGQSGALTGGTVGSAYTYSLTSTGGYGAITYSLLSGALPPGVSLASNGTISGTPTGVNTYNFNVRRTDSVGTILDTAYSINVVGVAIVAGQSGALTGGTVGSAYAYNLTSSGGYGAITYAVVAGALPPGVSLASNGAISGTPTGVANYSFTVRRTDSVASTQDTAYSINVVGVAITAGQSGALTGGTSGTAYSYQLTSTGGYGGITYAVIAGALPTGLSMNTAGTITGTPSAAAGYSFTVRRTDSVGTINDTAYTVAVSAPAAAVISSALGTNIGDMTASGGLAAAFNGNTAQAQAASAYKSNPASPYQGYVGKDYGAGVTKTITQVRAWGSSDNGFSVTFANPTVAVYGSNTAPTGPSNGTLLGTSGASADGAGQVRTITVSSPQAFRYNWIAITVGSFDGCICAELEFTGY